MSAEAKIQLSVKRADGAMLNVRGDTVEEFLAISGALADTQQCAGFELGIPNPHALTQFNQSQAVAAQVPVVAAPPQVSAPVASPALMPAQELVQQFPAQAPPVQQTAPPQAPPCTNCGTAKMWKPAGVSQKTGKPYNGFWSCPNYQAPGH